MESFEIASTLEEAIISRAKVTGSPVNGSIELLPLCNMNCGMCYVRLSPEEVQQKGRIRTTDEWIHVARQMAEEGVLFLLLTGGEPLLFPEFQRLYLELQQMGMILTINTNGTMIDEAWAEFFGKHKPRRINITMYGTNEETYEELCHYPGGFEKMMNAVRLLRERQVDVKLSASVTRENEKDLPRMHALSEELGVPFRADTYMMPAVRERTRPFKEQSRLLPEAAAKARMDALRQEMGPERFAQYQEQIRQEMELQEALQAELQKGERLQQELPARGRDCLAGNCSFTVNWQGELRPCVVMTEPAVSVFEHGFAEAWNQVKEQVQKIRIHAKCTACRFRPLCRTCPACALLETGSYEGVPEYMCRYAEASKHELDAMGAVSAKEGQINEWE